MWEVGSFIFSTREESGRQEGAFMIESACPVVVVVVAQSVKHIQVQGNGEHSLAPSTTFHTPCVCVCFRSRQSERTFQGSTEVGVGVDGVEVGV